MPAETNHSPNTRRLIVLGSTGSIGVSTLEVIQHLRRQGSFHFELVGLAAGRNATTLAAQAEAFDVPALAIVEDDGSVDFGARQNVCRGSDAALELIDQIARPGDLVVAAIVGAAGMPAVIRAIEIGCDIALANKETLVAAGALVMPLVREKNVSLLPVDSEHSAVFQCLRAGRTIDEVKRVVLTASGGPFRQTPRDEMRAATVEQALNHPTWSMGAKITIDSATLMNKALEVIEAHWLFDLPSEKIDAIIHPQSIVHSFVEFADGSVVAQLSPPDMKLPIQYALTYPRRVDGCARTLDWQQFSGLVFENVDARKFPSIDLAHTVIDRGGTAGAVLNAANEVVVAAFLDRRIAFGDIFEIVHATLESVPSQSISSLQDVFDADAESRNIARQLVEERKASETLV